MKSSKLKTKFWKEIQHVPFDPHRGPWHLDIGSLRLCGELRALPKENQHENSFDCMLPIHCLLGG